MLLKNSALTTYLLQLTFYHLPFTTYFLQLTFYYLLFTTYPIPLPKSFPTQPANSQKTATTNYLLQKSSLAMINLFPIQTQIFTHTISGHARMNR